MALRMRVTSVMKAEYKRRRPGQQWGEVIRAGWMVTRSEKVAPLLRGRGLSLQRGTTSFPEGTGMSAAADRVLQHVRSLAGEQALRELSDRELLRRFAAGREQAAFAVLVRRHGPLVLGAGRRVLGHVQDAEDVF